MVYSAKELDKMCGRPPTLTWTCDNGTCGKTLGPYYSQLNLEDVIKIHKINHVLAASRLK